MPFRVKTTAQAVFTAVKRGEIDGLLDEGKLFVTLNNGTLQRMRRNGKSQTWKREPDRFRIPFKYGFRGYGSINEGCMSNDGDYLIPQLFRHVNDLTEGK